MKRSRSEEDVSEAADDSNAALDEIGALQRWLTTEGSRGLDKLEARSSATTGMGVYAVQSIAPNAEIVSIPASAVLTVGKALERLGQACSGVPPELVMLLDMAAGRDDPTHAAHRYLSALPKALPDAPSWPETDLVFIDGTNLGAAARAAAIKIAQDYERYNIPNNITFESLRWARSMFYSRKFPSELIGEEAGALGILLPFLDLLNHQSGTQITWVGDGETISFVAGAEGAEAGAEMFNSYGAKSNEELMMVHGFALWDNAEDVYGLSLAVVDQQKQKQTLGPFYIHREASQLDQVFPDDLWAALADPFGEAPDDEEEPVVGIDLEDAEMLLATLRNRLTPFAATADEDTRLGGSEGDFSRGAMVARYRDGQRRVLQDGITLLETILLQPQDDERDDDDDD